MIGAIVLAAGRSERLPPQKLLLPLEDKPIICAVVDQLLASRVDEVVVVVGRDAEQIEAALSGRTVRLARNPDLRGEMLTSVRCGLEALSASCQAVLVALGDQPFLSPLVVDRLIESYETGDKGIVVPTHRSRRGHPVLISIRYRDEVLNAYERVGLRGLLRAHEDDVAEVAVSNPDVLEDLDTPDDYRRWRQKKTPEDNRQ